ncbi:MAG: DUF1848 domain-containing protein [Firmicutes bacterium]|nr:DUF1848 domain-containing protein [Bacillota bacterium]
MNNENDKEKPIRSISVPNLIISCSRRTDIPAFYPEWLLNRLNAGFCYVPNPINSKMLFRIPLDSSSVDAVVFWTKNPGSLLENRKQSGGKSILDLLDEKGYNYCFQFTVTGYPREIETNVPSLEHIFDVFRTISTRLQAKNSKTGVKRIIWRYDPVILTKELDTEYHLRNFSYITKKLHSYTDRCIISIVDLYEKTKRRLPPDFKDNLNSDPDSGEIRLLLSKMAEIAKSAGIKMFTCAEKDIYREAGIKKGSCIDGNLIEEIFGLKLSGKINRKAQGQREECNCVVSRDIGMNNTCLHNCAYCYATTSPEKAESCFNLHDPLSSMLIGNPTGHETIYEVSVKSEHCR